ncbi:MAG TPA: AraC family transcriptional regulator [Gemmatimonadales bacterium]|nr:AraC family transcriptional regulator [Gemmatimonadales bacterium]
MDRQREEDGRTASPSVLGMGQLVLRCHRFTVSTVTLPAGLSLRPHAHPHDQLAVVLAGQYTEMSASATATLSAGSILWRRAGEPHGNVVGAHAAEVLLVDLAPAAARQLCLPRVDAATYFAPGTFAEIYYGLRSELRRPDGASRVAIEGWVCVLAADAGRSARGPQAPAPAWLSRAVSLIQAGYPHRIRLSRLAAAAGVHPVTVAAAFRRHLGKSVGEYVMDLRIAHARRELAHTRRTIAAIAMEAGFYDESHLGRVFRRRFGVAPGALRHRPWRH